MNPQAFAQALNDIDLPDAHKDYLRGIARSSVDITLSEMPAQDAASRFGGKPYVPNDFRWPKHDKGEYRFLGQIDFTHVPSSPAPLPSQGLLSLFFAYDDDGEVFWQDPGYVLAFYWSDTSGFSIYQRNDLPAANAQQKSIAIELTNAIDLPRHREVRSDWPFNDETCDWLFYDLPRDVNASSEYLLGYPSYCTLGYDPTPDEGWQSLLTLRSLDAFDWCWHDGDKLMVFIETERLAKSDFSHLRCDAG